MTNPDNDVICAISTPPGEGGIGIVRLSGDNAFRIARGHFRLPEEKSAGVLNEDFIPSPRRLYYGYMVDEAEQLVDEVLFAFMPAPHTYTREDVVEIHAHGGAVPLQAIFHLMIGRGARIAEAGEFTKRAFLNGRIDLVQAESVLSLIRAKTEKGLQAAVKSLHGRLSAQVQEIRWGVLEVLGEAEAEAEFFYEEIEEDEKAQEQVYEQVKELLRKCEELVRRRQQGKILQEGLKTVILGKPNVGKSSLYNYLLQEERAIVTEVPGTTRDLLMEYVNIGGVPLRIIDTAGLRREADRVEKKGIEFSQKAIQEADLLLLLLDASEELGEEDYWIYNQLETGEDQMLFIIINKIDRGQILTAEKARRSFRAQKVIECSVLSGEGLDALEEEIVESANLGEAMSGESDIIMEARQGELMQKATQALKDALNGLQEGFPLDVVTIDLHRAYGFLGELIGEEVGEDLLDHIFSRFCIGK